MYKKCLDLLKKYFQLDLYFFSSLVSTSPLSCISMINQACKVIPEIINVNSSELLLYPFSIKTNKCRGRKTHKMA